MGPHQYCNYIHTSHHIGYILSQPWVCVWSRVHITIKETRVCKHMVVFSPFGRMLGCVQNTLGLLRVFCSNEAKQVRIGPSITIKYEALLLRGLSLQIAKLDTGTEVLPVPGNSVNPAPIITIRQLLQTTT